MVASPPLTTTSFLPEGEPLSPLFEDAALPRFALPGALESAYGGGLGFERPRAFANFVSSVDGVAAFPDRGESGHVVSGGNAADRFVMGLLRACADTVLVAAGTFRKTPGARWTADAIYPAGAAHFAEARRALGLATAPRFVLLTGSGDLDATGPALEDALVVTTANGRARLAGKLPATARVLTVASDPIRLEDVVARLAAEGTRLLLAEGGPSLLSELVRGRLLDELFLTISPTLFGRFPDDHRKSIADGADLGGVPMHLLSARRHRSFLFLRYGIPRRA